LPPWSRRSFSSRIRRLASASDVSSLYFDKNMAGVSLVYHGRGRVLLPTPAIDQLENMQARRGLNDGRGFPSFIFPNISAELFGQLRSGTSVKHSAFRHASGASRIRRPPAQILHRSLIVPGPHPRVVAFPQLQPDWPAPAIE
jgi:hypothetical protein